MEAVANLLLMLGSLLILAGISARSGGHPEVAYTLMTLAASSLAFAALLSG